MLSPSPRAIRPDVGRGRQSCLVTETDATPLPNRVFVVARGHLADAMRIRGELNDLVELDARCPGGLAARRTKPRASLARAAPVLQGLPGVIECPTVGTPQHQALKRARRYPNGKRRGASAAIIGVV